jgi:hypothetical protein
MVKYGCGICDKLYNTFEEAEKCEKTGIVGPILKPGLLFSNKEFMNGFMIFYNETDAKGHERRYHFEEIISESNRAHSLTYSLQDFTIPSSKLKEWIKPYKISTEEELDMLNKRIKEEAHGTKGIGMYMKMLGIKELHNKCNLEDFL